MKKYVAKRYISVLLLIFIISVFSLYADHSSR